MEYCGGCDARRRVEDVGEVFFVFVRDSSGYSDALGGAGIKRRGKARIKKGKSESKVEVKC